MKNQAATSVIFQDYKSTLFLDVIPCSLVEFHQRFGDMNCVRLQGKNENQVKAMNSKTGIRGR
jgi:hypothetical protein